MLENKHVLTVDDSATIRLFLRALLTGSGAEVDEAATAEEALRKCRSRQRYDLILLDLLLPDADGIDVLRQLREFDTESPVVMLTGMGGIKSATTAVREGADGYMEKNDLISNGDKAEFFYALEQAIERRAGLVAQQELQQFKTDFYSMITHDLRNPAGSILIALQILTSDDLGGLNDGQHQLLSIALAAAEQTNSLINDYLDFAKIDAGYLRIEPGETELCALVAEATRLAGMQARARHQELIVNLPAPPIQGWVDAERLKQVVENLISNAIKYTPEGGAINVVLNVEDGHAVLKVKDTGMGISPEQMKDLFVKYHRGTSKHVRTIRGTGLGLFIVKEIVEAHGGTITVDSEGIPGKGSTFAMRVPLLPQTVEPD
jgi:signal transduction histidine kinase